MDVPYCYISRAQTHDIEAVAFDIASKISCKSLPSPATATGMLHLRTTCVRFWLDSREETGMVVGDMMEVHEMRMESSQSLPLHCCRSRKSLRTWTSLYSARRDRPWKELWSLTHDRRVTIAYHEHAKEHFSGRTVLMHPYACVSSIESRLRIQPYQHFQTQRG